MRSRLLELRVGLSLLSLSSSISCFGWGMLMIGPVLGLNDATAARRLVRLLLADPLNSRESWEDALDAYGEDTERGLLIR